jgi:hypothetical protein
LSINIFSFNDLLKPSIQLYRQTNKNNFGYRLAIREDTTG